MAALACDPFDPSQHMAGGARAGRGEGGKRRPERRALVADAKHNGFARLGGNCERAERPVPEGKGKAEVLVEMSGVGGVMELVVGGLCRIRPAMPVNAIHILLCRR